MLPSDEYFRVSHFFTGEGVPTGAAVVYCVRNTGILDLAGVAAVAHDRFNDEITPWLCEDVTMGETLCKQGPDDTGPSVLVSAPTATGTEPDPSSPPGTAALVTKGTASGGRRGRGRMYLPGLADAVVEDGGTLQTAFLGNLQGGVQAWHDELDTAGIPLHLEHGPATEWVLVNGQPRRIPVAGSVPAPSPVLSVSVATQTATQRRRNRR